MNKSYFIMSLVIVITGCLKSELTVQVTSGLSCEETSIVQQTLFVSKVYVSIWPSVETA